MKNKPWRFIDSGPGAGDYNMALDGVLIDSFMSGRCGPVFRLYEWEPGALSLGRFQDSSKGINWPWLRDNGILAVRRMTGGGAIFHTLELTYSLVCREEDLGTSGVKAAFEKTCQFLIHAYRALGLNAQFAKDAFPGNEDLGRKTAVCFAGKELYDIVAGGRKIGGNAQRRVEKVIFQHGSIPIQLDWTSLEALFPKQELPRGDDTASLWDLGLRITSGELKKVIIDSLQSVLDIQLIQDELTPIENQSLGIKRTEVLISPA